MHPASPADPDDLLRQVAWVRGLARSLLADPDEAEDAAQQAWVAALSGDRVARRDGRAWMAGVLHNLARRRHRDAGRRERRERLAARPEAVASTVDVVAQAELHRRLVSAVLELDEPYRTTVLKRYVRELSAEDIAREEGVPGATVRSRVHRALGMLRQRLDGEFEGGRRAWSAALAPLAMLGGAARVAAVGSAAVGSTSVPLSFVGVVLMSAKAKFVLGGACLLLVCGLLWSVWPDDGAAEPRAADGGSLPPIAAGTDEGRVLPAVRDAALPRVQEGGGDAPRVSTRSPESDGDPVLVGDPILLRGRVVDPEGHPVVGADVWFFPNRYLQRDMGIEWNGTRPGAVDRLPRTTTASDGSFELRGILPVGLPSSGTLGDRFPSIVIRHASFALCQHACAGLMAGDYEAGDIVLHPGGWVTGRTVDDEGRPVSGAAVLVRNNAISPGHAQQAGSWTESAITCALASDVSDAAGRFLVGPFSPGTIDARVDSEDAPDLEIEKIEVRVDERIDVGDVVLVPGGVLRGSVHDAEGHPVVGAAVLLARKYAERPHPGSEAIQDGLLAEWEYAQPVSRGTTDEHGAFTLRGVQPTNHRLFVDAPGFELLALDDVVPGAPTLGVVLVRQATLQLTLVDADGAPVQGAAVQAVRRTGRSYAKGDPRLDVLSGAAARAATATEGDPDGFFLVQRLGTWRTDIVASAPGFATRGIVVEGVVPPEVVTRTVELRRESTVTGRVLGADGAPIADAVVTGGPPDSARVDLPSARTTTGSDGTYVLHGLQHGDWNIAADAKGFLSASRPITVPKEQSVRDVDLTLEPGGRIHGVNYAADGAPRRGLQMLAIRLSKGSGPSSAQVTTDTQGAFRFEGLSAGQWRVSDRPEVVVDLPPGGQVRIDVHEQRGPVLRGRVLTAAGVPLQAQVSACADLNGRLMPRSNSWTDDQGRYELKLLPAVEYGIVAYAFDPPAGCMLPVWLTLADAQERQHDIVFSGGPFSARIVDDVTGQPVPDAPLFLVPQEDGRPSMMLVRVNDMPLWPSSDEAGQVTLPFAPAGSYRLTVRHPAYLELNITPFELRSTPRDVVELRLQRGATVRGRVTLPSGVPVPDDTAVYRQSDPSVTPAGLAWTEEGRFEFTGLAPGPVWIRVSNGIWSNGAFDQPVLAERYLDLKPGEVVELELQANP